MFFGGKIKISFMDAVRQNDFEAMRAADISGVTLEDFKTAYRTLEDNNPDWETRQDTDLLKATISGVKNTIKRMEDCTEKPTMS